MTRLNQQLQAWLDKRPWAYTPGWCKYCAAKVAGDVCRAHNDLPPIERGDR